MQAPSTGPGTYVGQFLLAPQPVEALHDFPRITIGTYTLHHHPAVQVLKASADTTEVALIGYWYDYRHPEWTDQEILDSLAGIADLNELIRALSPLCGVFLVVHRTATTFTLISDLCCIREAFIMHHDQGVVVGSSPNILELVKQLPVQHHEFYSSPAFDSLRNWFGDNTHLDGVTRMRSNRYLNLHTGKLVRYFPVEKQFTLDVDEGVERILTIFNGILQAATRRERLLIALSAGWDSRLLLSLARPYLDRISFFVIRADHNSVSDVEIPKRLAWKLRVPFSYLSFPSYKKTVDPGYIDYPFLNAINVQATENLINFTGPRKTVTGNISEIARHEYGFVEPVTGELLATFAKYPGQPYCIRHYDAWIQENRATFEANGYRILDMFYWEESLPKLGKAASEALALGRTIFPPFNCRDLILTFYAIDKKYRAKQQNLLYQKLINRVWPETLSEPVNPDFKKTVIRYLEKLGIYHLYKKIWPKGFSIR